MTRIDPQLPRQPAVTSAPVSPPTTPAPSAGRGGAAGARSTAIAPPGLVAEPGTSAAAKLIQTPQGRSAVGLPPTGEADSGTLQNLDPHTVGDGESWATIASQYGLSEAALRAANPSAGDAAPAAGTNVRVPDLDGDATSTATLRGAFGASQPGAGTEQADQILHGPPCLRGMGGLLRLPAALLGLRCGARNSRDGTLGSTRARTPRDGQADT